MWHPDVDLTYPLKRRNLTLSYDMFVAPTRLFRQSFSTSSILRADFTHVVSTCIFQSLDLEVEGRNRLSVQE